MYWRDHGSKQDSCAYIILDGYTASGRFLWGEGVASREGIRSGADSEKPFMFTKVGNDADDGIIEGGNKEAGMITLKIKMTTRIGPRPNNAIKPVPSSPYGKKAPGSLRIGYGAERKVCPQAPATWHVKPTKTHVTFVFRYRSRGMSPQSHNTSAILMNMIQNSCRPRESWLEHPNLNQNAYALKCAAFRACLPVSLLVLPLPPPLFRHQMKPRA